MRTRKCKENGSAVCFACIVARARRCFRAAPIVAFVVDGTDPLGAALAEMVRRLRCGFLCRSAPRPCAPHAFVLGAASLSDLQIIASGLATADRWLHAEGDRRQTPGAAALSAQLARAESSRTVFVTEGVRSVRALSQAEQARGEVVSTSQAVTAMQDAIREIHEETCGRITLLPSQQRAPDWR